MLGTEVIKLKKDVQLLKNKWQKSLWSSICIDVSLVAILRNDARVTFTEDQNLKPFKNSQTFVFQVAGEKKTTFNNVHE